MPFIPLLIMFIENWLHSVIRKELQTDLDYQRFVGKTALPQVSRGDIEDFQFYRINRVIRYATENSPFYRDKLNGVPELRFREDLSGLPFTDPHDLEDSPYKLLCVSLGGIARVFSHFTTGTMSGRPKKIFFTYGDADGIVNSMKAIIETVLEAVKLNPEGCKVHIFLPNNGSPMSMAGLISRGVEQFGGTPIIGDCNAMTPEQICRIEEVKPHMLMGSAFRIWRITQEVRRSHDLAGIGVKAVFITSEYLSAAMRRRLEHYWKAEVFHHYGMTEPGFAIGVECAAHDGFHFDETRMLFEVVEPQTGEVLQDGQEGELVFTSLHREGMPLIRYRTGDVACLKREPCACGAATLTRIGTLPKRVGLVVKIGDGEEVYTSLFDEVLYEVPGLIDYRVFITNDGEKDILTCKVEMLGGLPRTGERVLQNQSEGDIVSTICHSEESQNPEISTRHSREGGNLDTGVEGWIHATAHLRPNQARNDTSVIAAEVTQRILTIPPVRNCLESGLMNQPVVEFVERGVLRRGGRRMKRRIVDER